MQGSVLSSVLSKSSELSSRDVSIFTLAGLVLVYIANLIKKKFNYSIDAPVAGSKSRWEPEWWLRLRFPFTSKEILYSGYGQFKNRIFKIVRNDSDIFVLPHTYLKQLGNLTEDHSSSSKGQIRNMADQWSTGCDIILGSDVHFRMIQQVLTKNINATIPMMNEELYLALEKEIPDCKGKWTELNMFDVLARITARIAMRVFVGLEACRNEDWLKASLDYDINVGTTVVFLRMFPPFLHPIIARMLPSWWRAYKNIKTAENIIGPIIQKRAEAKARGKFKYEKPIDLMQWIWESADEADAQPKAMALRMLVVGLAALHTTSMATSHAMYDLCAHPEYVAPLREEMLQVLREDGGWDKHTLAKLKKLDSFVKETQRFSPASLMSFNRYLFKPFTLEDGTHLPAGTHVAMAAHPILMDPDNLSHPGEFDGFRFYRMREDQSDPDNVNKHQLASIDSTNLHFGGGRYGCPGRFFASASIKLMFCHLLLKYDFKYPVGKGRPRNMYADENIFPDQTATLLIRERENPEADVDEILRIAGDLENWDLKGVE